MKRWLKNNRGFILFLVLLGVFRTAVADWNPIPSGSMRPTLVEGDVVLVNRLAYDFKVPLTDRIVLELGAPRRGDVVTFSSPKDGIRLIKRLVAIPGDTVEIRDQRLYVNGQTSEYVDAQRIDEPTDYGGTTPAIRVRERSAGSERAVQFFSSNGSAFGPVAVPADHYFFLGDNRDNSLDSRYFGFVPRDKLIGRAHRILVSARITSDWGPRFERFGERIE